MADSASTGDRWGWLPRLDRLRLVSLGIVVAVVVLNLVQQPGLITFDTKLDLQFDASGFMGRSLELWNPDSVVGGLQNQASGYLFPMGPTFWLGGLLGVPMWIWERLWSAAIMVVAYEGTRRLAARWPGIGPWGAVVAGLAYMLAPRVLLTVGGLSGETLPTAVLPWTVLPVLLYLRGRVGRGRAFLWSAATVPLMGGQNATLVLACLVLPGLLLLLVGGRGWLRRLGDAAWWGGLAALASLWWVVPLFLLGGYAPPFLDFIESSRNTAGSIGWLTSLRGTGHWVAFFPGGGTAGWAGGYDVVSSPVLLFTTAAVAAVGLIGLAQPGLFARRALVGALLVGLTLLTLGAGGWTGSILSSWWLELLDGPLAPLRNIHKFDPVVRLPLSLGVGAFLTVGLPRLLAGVRDWPARRRATTRVAATAAVVVAVLAAAQPALFGDLRVQGGMRDLSPAWRAAAAYLDEQPGPVNALVLPGSGFAVQTWGRTIDEPIQVLDPPPWLARAQVTVAPAGTIRLLDSIESQIDQGRPDPGLSDALRRLGVTHVVVRNDLDDESTDAPTPRVVYSSLSGAPDLTSVASFGTTPGGYPDVEIFAVGGAAPEVRAGVPDAVDPAVVQGGPEVIDQLVSAGLVAPGRATELATDPDRPVDVLTDSNRRIERSFGRVHDAESAVMTADEPFRVDRRVHDYVGDQIPTALTTAEYEGAELVTASSSQGYADILGPVRPAEAPYAAFDRSALTAWTSAPFTDPVGQWIEARYAEPTDVGPISLWFDEDAGAAVSRVRITTDSGSVTADVDEEGRAIDVTPEGEQTTRLRVTVLAASGEPQVRLVNLSTGDQEIGRSLRVPGVATEDTSVHLSSELARRPCLTSATNVSCAQERDVETPETSGFDRTVEVGTAVRWRLGGRAVATNGPALDALFAPLSDTQVAALASSTFAGDPAVMAANAVDGRPETSWYASPLDATPVLQLSWKQKRKVTGVLAQLDAAQPGTLPETLVVDPTTRPKDVQLVATTGPNAGEMRPVRTNRLRISVPAGTDLGDGLGISELDIGGLEDLVHTADPATPTGLACGFGPTVEVEGTTVQTRVVGTLGDVVSGAELTVEPCGGTKTLSVSEGVHRIRVTNPSGFAVSRLWFTPAGQTPSADPSGASEMEIESWGSTDRSVAVRAAGDALLVVPQSFNRGWVATLDGQVLDPLTVDGWKQAWQLPPDADGTVRLHFEPQRAFAVSIVGGLVLAALLCLAALVSLLWWLRRARTEPSAESTFPGDPVDPTDAHRGPWSRREIVVAVAGVCVLALVSLPLAAGVGLGLLVRRSGALALAGTCGALVVGAALVAAVGPGSVVVPPPLADALVALAVGTVVGYVLSSAREPEGATT